jgi:hypothetical protein
MRDSRKRVVGEEHDSHSPEDTARRLFGGMRY